jgi:hypothetical protein
MGFDEIWMMGFCDGFYNLNNALEMILGVITWPMHDLNWTLATTLSITNWVSMMTSDIMFWIELWWWCYV